MKIKIIVAAVSTSIVLSGCVPGMHMTKPSNYTETITINGKVVKPELVPITPDLVLEQRKAEEQALQYLIDSYHPPKGFTTDTQNYDYHIGKQDVLNIIVWDYDSLTNPGQQISTSNNSTMTGFTVNSMGQVFYPYIGYVTVEGLTVSEARDKISKELSQYIKHPQVTVEVVGFHSQRINVMGAVYKQQSIPVTNTPMTVLDAVNASGGYIPCGNQLKTDSQGNSGTNSNCADPTHVTITHGEYEATVDITSLRSPIGTSENFVLDDNTIVNVPVNTSYKVYILGSVRVPGVYNMVENRMDLREALAAAAGPDRNSAPQYTYIVRSYGDKPEVFSINMRSPDAFLLAGHFELKPQDVVFVSSSALADTNQVLSYISPLISTFFSTASLAIAINK